MIEQASLHDITTIEDPSRSQQLYGVLDGFPHTYEINIREPLLLHTEILIPDVQNATGNVSVIIIKETGSRGRVTEVARILARDATWESFFEWWGGDRYRRGGKYDAELAPGVYRIEVSTPDNVSPYVLVIGTQEASHIVRYFDLLTRVGDVKEFFGKSRWTMIGSALVYGPLLVIIGVSLCWFLYRRRK
jgi:hypothetical protein